MLVKRIFVNLPVRDLEATKAFYGGLGFTFNEKFTDENAAAMEMGDNISAMLLKEDFFRTFLDGHDIADTSTHKEVLNAIQVESREQVEELMAKAIELGGSEYRAAQDYGWMYSRAFQDLDGHIWELMHLDESQIPEDPSQVEPLNPPEPAEE